MADHNFTPGAVLVMAVIYFGYMIAEKLGLV